MAPSALRAAACAGAALGASALSLSRDAPPGTPLSSKAAAQLLAKQDVARPFPADLDRWGHGPLFVENSSLYHTTVKSRMGEYDLTIAAFDKRSDQGVSGGLLAGNGWETEHISELCKEFKEFGSVGNFLDVGANIGTFAIAMADCVKFTGGRVIAVEGMPPIADHLAVGILANNLQNDVDMYNYAVGAPDDPKKVTMSLNPVNKGGSTVKGNKPFTEMSDDQLQDLFHPGKKARQPWDPKVAVQEYDVPLTTADLILKYNPAMKAISFAKVDIEGHEGHFLRGAEHFFSQYPPCLMTIELIPEWLERAGTPLQEILDSLVRWGYKDVPSVAQIQKASSQAKTKTFTQKNFTACLERVGAHAKEVNARPEVDHSDPSALSRVMAQEARAKELDAMMVRQTDWWQAPHERRAEEEGKDSPMIVAPASEGK